MRAPSLAGLHGQPTPLQDGRVVVADAQYLHDSILLPNRDVAAGYEARMPTYATLIDEADVTALVAYLQSLAASQPAGARP